MREKVVGARVFQECSLRMLEEYLANSFASSAALESTRRTSGTSH